MKEFRNEISENIRSGTFEKIRKDVSIDIRNTVFFDAKGGLIIVLKSNLYNEVME